VAVNEGPVFEDLSGTMLAHSCSYKWQQVPAVLLLFYFLHFLLVIDK
jgi:hypothetical protein